VDQAVSAREGEGGAVGEAPTAAPEPDDSAVGATAAAPKGPATNAAADSFAGSSGTSSITQPRGAAALGVRSLGIRAGERQLVSELSVEFRAGEVTAILGRNGSGKTLTLHALAGLRRPQQGIVRLDGTPLDQLRRRAIAQRLGVLLQDLEESFTSTALEAVLIGRHPHLPAWRWESADDDRLAHDALARVQMESFAERSTDKLSGGERRRIAIASLLAQAPQIFLLDEPTNHLDPHHQIAVLELFRTQANAGRTVIATLHDPTLAARFADRVILLFGDGRWVEGPMRETLTSDTLSELYLTRILQIDTPERRVFVSA
jgi:iron complex transport system ATP-binding protein